MYFQHRSKMSVGLFILLAAHQLGCSAENSGGSRPAGSGGAGGSVSPTGSTGDGPFPTGGGETTGSGGSDNPDCDPKLTGVVRDFRAYNGGTGHPDFEVFAGTGQKGIVKNELGADHKPVYAPPGPTANTTGAEAFAQWYNDTAGVNVRIPFSIELTAGQNGVATYLSNDFFPADGQGFGNEGMDHNYSFKLHMTFRYKGGEVFSFTGDDDLWVFFNNHLGIDLGGLHDALTETINLDEHAAELGLVVGQEYALDFFQAERHSTGSNFGIQSTLDFTNCEPVIF